METIDLFIKKRLKELISSKGVAEKKISELLGYNRSYISNILNGKNMPSFEALNSICGYFGISMSDFFKDELTNSKSSRYLYEHLESILEEEDIEDFTNIVKTLNNKDVKALISSYKKFNNIGESN